MQVPSDVGRWRLVRKVVAEMDREETIQGAARAIWEWFRSYCGRVCPDVEPHQWLSSSKKCLLCDFGKTLKEHWIREQIAKVVLEHAGVIEKTMLDYELEMLADRSMRILFSDEEVQDILQRAGERTTRRLPNPDSD